MSLAATEGLPGLAVPGVFWLWVFGGLFFAGALGFLAGGLVYSIASKNRLRKLLDAPGSLMPIVREQLDAAVEATTALKERKQVVLSKEETSELTQRRDNLQALLNEIVQLQQDVALAMAGKPALGKANSVSFEMTWILEPADERTKLPNTEAMAVNLHALLDKTTENAKNSGFLFVQADGLDKIEGRFGSEGRDALFKKFCSVVLRAVRDQDLVCRYDADTLAVLFPSLELKEGPMLAHSIRKSLLNYQFRITETGPSVILNAHFGYTDCLPHENEDLVLNRAGNALAKSQSRGKNQMHAHDGRLMEQLRRSHYTS